MSTAIRVRDLTKDYGGLQAVRNANFDIDAGSCVGLLGENGAGKSSLIKMIHCSSPITSGSIEILDTPMMGNERRVKSRMGVVSQDNNLDSEFNVIENLIIYARYHGIDKSTAKERSAKLLESFGLSEYSGAECSELSGGMRRKLVIARAMINNPALILLDEPTTGLDPSARHLVWQQLKLLKRSGVSMLLTTHYIEEAYHLCDRIIVVEKGRILADGPPDNLINDYIGEAILEIDFSKYEKSSSAIKEVKHVLRGWGGHGFVFSRDFPGLEQFVARTGCGKLRAATLEDVFLGLTGHPIGSESEKGRMT